MASMKAASSLTLLANRAMRTLMPTSNRFLVRVNRGLCTSSDDMDMDKVNDMFAEARLLLQDANDAMGTVYFEEEYNDAKSLTNETLAAYRRLVSQDAGGKIAAANEPKMKQLEEELRILTDTLINDDH